MGANRELQHKGWSQKQKKIYFCEKSNTFTVSPSAELLDVGSFRDSKIDASAKNDVNELIRYNGVPTVNFRYQTWKYSIRVELEDCH